MKNETIKKLNSVFCSNLTKTEMKAYGEGIIKFWGAVFEEELVDYAKAVECRKLDPNDEEDSEILLNMGYDEGFLLTDEGSKKFYSKQDEVIKTFKKVFGKHECEWFDFSGGLVD